MMLEEDIVSIRSPVKNYDRATASLLDNSELVLKRLLAKDVEKLLYTDSLCIFDSTNSESPKIGDYAVSIKSSVHNELDCIEVSLRSNGVLDECPCGSSIQAFVDKGNLRTIFHDQTDFMNIPGKYSSRRLVVKLNATARMYEVTFTKRIGDETTTAEHAYPIEPRIIFDGAQFLLDRILMRYHYDDRHIKRTQREDPLQFYAIDSAGNLATSTLSFVGSDERELDGAPRSVRTMKRVLQTCEPEQPAGDSSSVKGDFSQAASPHPLTPTAASPGGSEGEGVRIEGVTWTNSFLSDGHIFSRVQKGNPATIHVMEMPELLDEPDLYLRKPIIEREKLDWRDDIQLRSKYEDRVEFEKAKHASYLKANPEVLKLLSDFTQSLYLRKPKNTLRFAAEYFGAFAMQAKLPGATSDSVNIMPFEMDSRWSQMNCFFHNRIDEIHHLAGILSRGELPDSCTT